LSGALCPSQNIDDTLQEIKKNLSDRFRDNLQCLILYGSWAKGSPRKNSDVDLLAIFQIVDREIRESLFDASRGAEGRSITLVPSSLEDFRKEKIPLYTAVKREGNIIYGHADLSINPEPPEVKYSEFFERSREFESQKVKIAEELLEKDLLSSVADLCYIASKHAIQASLAMKGEGYSSKVHILQPLVEKYFGKEIGTAFRNLLELYVKSEYGVHFLSEEEPRAAIDYAKKLLKVLYNRQTDRPARGNGQRKYPFG
jgi:predicted nucleotidyltransferase